MPSRAGSRRSREGVGASAIVAEPGIPFILAGHRLLTLSDRRVASTPPMGSLIKKRRKRMRKKKHKKMLKRTRFQRRNK